MTDSSSFSSLLALVDSHLSQTGIQESRSDEGNSVSNRIPIPSFSGGQSGTFSDTLLSFPPGQRLPIPSFNLSQSPIQNVLAEQVANMLRAKEIKRQQEEEKLRLAEEMKKMKLEEDESVIDLMQALQTPCNPGPSREECEYMSSSSSSSSCESLFEPKFIDCDEVPEKAKTPEPVLPCTTDMSYIMFEKVHKANCSSFGKVLTSRVKPRTGPYVLENIAKHIKRFEFKEPSPCDCIKEKQRKPTCNSTFIPDIINFM